MYQDNLFNELIIDNFAGGGGASVGIELATGRPVDIAINHDADAIAMHSVNHPYTQHFQEDVFAIDPEEVTGGRPVGIAWFSPDCKHFSRAKGNKPVEHKIRGLSWVIIKWAMSSVAPRCIFMENVEEIQTWGPLIYVEGKEISELERMPGSWRPDPERAGETFKAFVGMLSDGVAPDCPALAEACEFLKIGRGSAEEQRLIKGLGYKLEFRTIRACDLGAPTIRKRFYLVARNDGKPIVFPKATHGKGKGLKPYRTAAECIDWSIPCPSIFERKKPLVKNTLRRVARGLDKFVIKNPKPYILEMNFDNPFQDVDRPMSTQTSANHHYLITPELVQVNHSGDSLRGQKVDDTFPTITQKHGFGVATPVLVECSHKNGPGVHGVDAPMNTQTGKACFAVETPFLTPIGYGEHKKQAPRVNSVNEPVSTVVSSCKQYLTAPALLQYHSEQSKGEVRGQKITEPMPTLTTSAGHFAEIRTYLLPVDSTQDLYHWNEVRKLLNEYADYSIKENEILIIEIAGIPYFIGDIGMRMLKAEELKLAQGFPVDYIIDIERHIGKKYSEAKQIARLGNAVCPPVATALIRANCADMAYKKPLRTVAELERAISGA